MPRLLAQLTFALPGLFIAGVAPGWAQVTPTQVVDSAFRLLAQRDCIPFAALVHPRSLDELRAGSLSWLILTAEARRAGKETWHSSEEDSTVLTTERVSAVGNERVATFPGAPTIAHLASMSSPDYFAAWCEAAYGASAYHGVWTALPDLRRRVIGPVQDGDSLAHVVYRSESQDISMRDLFDSTPGRVLELSVDLPGHLWIMPVEKTDRGWKLVIGHFNEFGSRIEVGLVPDSSAPSPTSEVKRTTRVTATDLPAHWPKKVRPGPAETVRLAFRAFERGDWAALAAFVHPQRLAPFQREQLAHLSIGIQRRGDSLPPDMMAGVANLEVPGFPRKPTIGELAALNPAAFFVRWCEAVYEGDPRAPGPTKVRGQRQVIGAVVEDGLEAHVLYRASIGYNAPWHVYTMSLRRTESAWRLLLNTDIGWTGDVEWLFPH